LTVLGRPDFDDRFGFKLATIYKVVSLFSLPNDTFMLKILPKDSKSY